MDACPELNLGVCVDTAHLFARGGTFGPKKVLKPRLAKSKGRWGCDRVPVVHVNDSKMALGTRVDRHEHIGKGKIGIDAFRMILNHPRLAACAFILETPVDLPGDEREMLQRCGDLRGAWWWRRGWA